MKSVRITVEKIEADPDNPRRTFDASDIAALAENMKAIGQQVPVIVYQCGEKFRLADGERRWRAATVSHIPDLMAIVLPQKPDETALRIMQMSLEAHKVAHSPMERSNLLTKIKQETGWPVGELADRLQMSQPLVSKLLAFQRLDTSLQALVHSGGLDMEKAYLVAGETPERQVILINESSGLSRDQLRSRVRNSDADQPKAKRAVFMLPGGISVIVQGLEVSLGQALDSLLEVAKEMRNGLKQGLDITTQQRVMKDKAK